MLTDASRPERLDLLFAASGSDAAGVPLVIPHLGGRCAVAVTEAVLATAAGATVRVLPAPSGSAARASAAAWHRDMWLAMSADDRARLLLAAGPTAAGLLGVDDPVQGLAFVEDPWLVLGAIAGDGLPKVRTLEAVEAEPERAGARLRRWANPQSAALIASVGGAELLPVAIGPPADADRWRTLLFDEALRRVEVVTGSARAAAARRVAGHVGAPPKPVMRAVAQAGEASSPPPRASQRQAELLAGLNWLDVELYERHADAHTTFPALEPTR